MDRKSFFIGMLAGVVLAILGVCIFGYIKLHYFDGSDQIEYLENPVSYNHSTETSFKVFQVLGDAALAKESSDENCRLFWGKTVLILGENMYNEQVITIQNPQLIGTYSYNAKNGMFMTVPVLDGDWVE